MRALFGRLSRFRSLRLTPEGTHFLLLALGVGGAAINTGHNLLYLFFAMMLSLIIVSGILSEQCFRRVEIRRHLPVPLFAKRAATARFTITNRKVRWPTFSLSILDMVSGKAVDRGVRLLHLPAGATSHQSYPLLITRRGYYRFEGVKLLTRFPFGLFTKAAILPLQDEILVYPQILPLPATLMQELIGRGHDEPALQRGQGAGLHNLRLYHPGDDSRTIHWKTTARRSQLIVRETEVESPLRVTLALYTGVPSRHTRPEMVSLPEDAFEEAVTLTASLANMFHQGGYQVRLLAGNDALSYGSGHAHFERLLKILALCRPTEMPSSSIIEPLRNLAVESTYTLVVLPVSDPIIMTVCQGVDRILVASDFVLQT